MNAVGILNGVDISIERNNGRARVLLTGGCESHVPEHVQDALREVFRPQGEVTLDFSGVTALSLPALRRLLQLARHGRSIGCRLSAVGVPAQYQSLVEAARFLPMFAGAEQDEAIPVLVEPRHAFAVYPTRTINGWPVRRGEALPFGATATAGGVNFSVFSRHADAVTLLLFEAGRMEPAVELPIPREYRIGDIWAITVFDLDIDDVEFAYRVDGPWSPLEGHRFDSSQRLLDPFAQSLAGGELWRHDNDGAARAWRSRVVPHDFDWRDDVSPQLPVEDLVIYEMHVRGFTKSPTAGVKFPGTFAGITEKIPYLKELGVNCVELMPIFEFDECENPRSNPITGERLLNYWGYSTIAFCAPKAGFAANGPLGLQVDELKELIAELHRAGIEVVLDVVFNHTAEQGDDGPTFSFRGLDNRVYYILTPDGEYLNFSGCGNTVNCNHPVVREFVRNCLRHWVTEYHIDGFRFDLASILGRDSNGNPLPDPPLLEALARDPVLSHTKLIAEAWDAGGLYQVGSFPAFGRWMEWNGRFRDCARRFLRGDAGQVAEMAQRIIGSPDLYPQRGPTASVNFITCHDGFTLADLVSYESKHNLSNGEDNRDGADANDSCNYGVEGPTDDPEILARRAQAMKNALALLFLSQGVPMLLMGDEVGRTQEGNNNAYCHDGPLTWLDWTLSERHPELFRFCREMIQFRHRHPATRHGAHAGQRPRHFSDLLDVTWHGIEPFQPDWGHPSRSIAVMLRLYTPEGLADVIYIALNMYWEQLQFRLPLPPDGWTWRSAIDTALPSPQDIAAADEPLAVHSVHQRRNVAAHSIQVLIAAPG